MLSFSPIPLLIKMPRARSSHSGPSESFAPRHGCFYLLYSVLPMIFRYLSSSSSISLYCASSSISVSHSLLNAVLASAILIIMSYRISYLLLFLFGQLWPPGKDILNVFSCAGSSPGYPYHNPDFCCHCAPPIASATISSKSEILWSSLSSSDGSGPGMNLI